MHFFHVHHITAVVDLEAGGAQGAGALVFADAHKGVLGVGVAVADTAHGKAAEVVGVVEVSHEHVEGLFHIVAGSGDILEDGVEEGSHVLALVVDAVHGHGVAADGVEHGEFELVFVGIEVDEQVIDFVEHFVGAGVLTVDLVQHHDDGKVQAKGLAEHEAGLGEGAFGSVHEQDNAVHHGEGAFHFTAEVGVAGGVEDVDAHILPLHGAVLGRDGDAAFTFQLHAVHDAVVHFLVGAEHAALLEKGVDEGGLTVVNVGNDSDIADRLVAGDGTHSLFLLGGCDDKARGPAYRARRVKILANIE